MLINLQFENLKGKENSLPKCHRKVMKQEATMMALYIQRPNGGGEWLTIY